MPEDPYLPSVVIDAVAEAVPWLLAFPVGYLLWVLIVRFCR